MSIKQIIRVSFLVVLMTTIVSTVTAAEREKHNPYTVLGLQLRANLVGQQYGASNESIGPLVFQEIVPCRLVTTLDADHYPVMVWGGPAFRPNENRSYPAAGHLVYGEFVNPCSDLIPMDAVALSLRLSSSQADAAGALYLEPSAVRPAAPALPLLVGDDSMDEANVLLRGGAFSVLSSDAATHLSIDVIGYFLKDSYAGPRGEKGEDGAQGPKGDKGDQGDRGVAGAKGERGDKGDRGEQGLQGIDGAKGERGEKGDRGEQGLQGIDGAKGAQGEKGERGEKGAQGIDGAKGERGEKGERGAQGAQGLMGPQGPMGPMGPQGPKGDKGDPGIKASMGGPLVFPPPGTIKINDSNVTKDSFIIVQYVEVSNGNAIGIESQSNGSFVATGSPNKPFRYIVINLK